MKSIFDPAVRRAILDRLDRLQPDARGRWGRMTCPQAICHLADALRGALGDRSVALVDAPFMRRVARHVALSLPLRWPKGVKTAPEFDQAASGTPPDEFDGDVAELKALVERFAAAGGSGLQPHVLFWDMTPGEWGRWGYRHLDHHLRQFGV